MRCENVKRRIPEQRSYFELCDEQVISNPTSPIHVLLEPLHVATGSFGGGDIPAAWKVSVVMDNLIATSSINAALQRMVAGPWMVKIRGRSWQLS